MFLLRDLRFVLCSRDHDVLCAQKVIGSFILVTHKSLGSENPFTRLVVTKSCIRQWHALLWFNFRAHLRKTLMTCAELSQGWKGSSQRLWMKEKEYVYVGFFSTLCVLFYTDTLYFVPQNNTRRMIIISNWLNTRIKVHAIWSTCNFR